MNKKETAFLGAHFFGSSPSSVISEDSSVSDD